VTAEDYDDYRVAHAITAITLTGENTLVTEGGIEWECACGATGKCPRPIAGHVLASHLDGWQ
jgi:hypothetical protein